MPTPSSKIPLTTLFCLLAAAACTTSTDRPDLVAIKVVKPTLLTGSTGGGVSCEINAGTPELSFGSFDPGVALYFLGVVVENRLPNNGSTAVGRLNTNDFQVEQARISYDFPDPAYRPSIAEHIVPANGLIKTGTTGVVGVQLAPADVDTALKAALSGGQLGTVRFKVRLEGKLADSSSFKTSLSEYTAQVCTGCGTPRPVCTAPKQAVACAAGQDSDVGCQ